MAAVKRLHTLLLAALLFLISCVIDGLLMEPVLCWHCFVFQVNLALNALPTA